MSSKRKKSSATAKPNLAKRQCIDMTHIPESLKREGYLTLEKQKSDIPSYLLCPVCKDLFVNPELFHCGHTVCKICIDNNRGTVCPVCKATCYSQLIPNFTVKQLIEEQFPTELKVRLEELTDMQALRKKLDQYQFSNRFTTLNNLFNKVLMENHYFLYQFVLKEMLLATVQPPVKEEEALFFLACKLSQPYVAICIGECIAYRSDPEQFITWWESEKPKKQKDHKKWAPLILLGLAKPNTTYETYKTLAKVMQVEIGNALPLQDWKNRPGYWIKDIDLGELVMEQAHSCFMCEYDDSSEFDSDDSDLDI